MYPRALGYLPDPGDGVVDQSTTFAEGSDPTAFTPNVVDTSWPGTTDTAPATRGPEDVTSQSVPQVLPDLVTTAAPVVRAAGVSPLVWLLLAAVGYAALRKGGGGRRDF